MPEAAHAHEIEDVKREEEASGEVGVSAATTPCAHMFSAQHRAYLQQPNSRSLLPVSVCLCTGVDEAAKEARGNVK